ncbi:hypothetical protein BpHYR1_005380 [Brachionus plicatilis]|uniref:Uncharacterized protein n=1 Tax=Brachionus plicatilis TaxID=10195 RepID=A0A3M7RGM2_BRAPC|nr:hypothetical protein BpHYR1_005380 [Brachionus plicatilis]
MVFLVQNIQNPKNLYDYDTCWMRSEQTDPYHGRFLAVIWPVNKTLNNLFEFDYEIKLILTSPSSKHVKI